MSSNYTLGDTVKLPLQITDNGIPISDTSMVPEVKKIIKPDGSVDSSFPAAMTLIDSEYSVYSYNYKPDRVGDYIVIFAFVLDGVEYSTMEHFIVSLGYSAVLPKAVAR